MTSDLAAGFDRMWSDLAPIGRNDATGGYRRYAWTREDAALREWFAGEAAARGLDLVEDRAGNLWAWWCADGRAPGAGNPGLAIGSHLDSVPDGGAFDGPLGVVSSLLALDALRDNGFAPTRPIAVVQFGDEEGARFGVACAGSRLITGLLDADRARGLTDADGVGLAEAVHRAGRDPQALGPDPEALARVAMFVELHVEQGPALADTDSPVGVGSGIWPHGRWLLDLPGEANHAGTTALVDRRDPMLVLAEAILAARRSASDSDVLATIGKVIVQPNAVNAVPSRVRAWLDARGPDADDVDAVVAGLTALVVDRGGAVRRESWTPETTFDLGLRDRISAMLAAAPVLATGAGHDAGALAEAGIPSAMLFVRNPTGVSHSPAEFAEREDCLAGVDALVTVVRGLAS